MKLIRLALLILAFLAAFSVSVHAQNSSFLLLGACDNEAQVCDATLDGRPIAVQAADGDSPKGLATGLITITGDNEFEQNGILYVTWPIDSANGISSVFLPVINN